MDLKTIKQFIDLARAEGLSDLKYETSELKISLSFPTKIQPEPAQRAVPQAEAAPVGKSIKNDESKAHHIVKSPFVGTYYASSAPGKPVFAKVGDRVKKGQVLCILEAMKIMNEIESDADGEIVEIFSENESLVEFAQPLFKLRV